MRISLKWLLILAFLLLGLLLTVGYSMLSVQYMIRGMDVVMVQDMEHTLKKLTSATHPPDAGEYADFYIAPDWAQQPAVIQRVFEQAPKTAGVLYKRRIAEQGDEHPNMHFVMRYRLGRENDGRDWYISRTLEHSTRSELVSTQIDSSRRRLHWILGSTLVLIVTIAVLLFRFLSRPAGRLLDWTRELDASELAQPVPDFGYSELNELASLMHGSLTSVQQTLNREQAFLRHASHELRTPIAVVRNNTELLRRLTERHTPLDDTRVLATVARLERAGITMAQLTETLLWLSRDDIASLPVRQIAPSDLLLQLVDELTFLLNNKTIELVVETDTDWQTRLPETPLRIVLGNIIRNAFQHTWEGRVEIYQQGSRIVVNNYDSTMPGENTLLASQNAADSGQYDQGFGLGLQLTRQLTKRLNWDYHNHAEADGHRVILDIGAGDGPSQPS
ncbi:HAMP domain-containing sensor histidine kinase [Oceanobacter sp. 3_MG-2023]|uniref:sensor histidine kinase n=1 Tax=Oceanobacter sp. 3_MG-2023 TaxID=3062622 RepID=UPI002735BF13|nr:HAMP domain-containing sensor histidine kinase [Oceanobacter sp. 3_MG-2023]MDP2506449.1 HAMP domain-containing sensor histidine kinase [Oceanobacter sp. 3_MG-2023]